MRRSDRQLSDQDAQSLLKKGSYGVLSAVDAQGAPYAVPVNYAYSDGRIVFHHAAGAGAIEECLAHDARACFTVVVDAQVASERFTTEYESVIVRGRVERLADEGECTAALMALIERYSPDHREKGERYVDAMASKADAFALIPDEVTGKGNIKR